MAQLDLVFLIDATGSMGPYIHEVRTRLLELVSALERSPLCQSLRLGIVSYRDHPPQDHSYVTRVVPLTNDIERVHAAVSEVAASGGGDGPEAVTDGLFDLVRLAWRPSAAKAVVWFGDAPPHGYLIEQFLNVASNTRTDSYGGSVDNRIRFALAAVDAVIAAIGASRTGIRISPYGVFNGSTSDPDTDAVYLALAKALEARKIAYIHFVDHTSMGAPPPKPELYAQIREVFTGAVILSGGYTDADGAEKALEANKGDVVAFGRPFLANPTLPAKLKTGAKLTDPDEATFYTPGPKGYIDYPA